MLPAQVSYWTLEEGKRHNTVVEKESFRHNVAMEQYNREQLAVKREEMEANIRLREQELEEQHRSNVAREQYNAQMAQLSFVSAAETQRHNLVYENEVNRHNRESETISQQNVDLGFTNAGINSRNADIRERQVTYEHDFNQQKVTQGWFSVGSNLFSAIGNTAIKFAALFG